MTAPTVFISYSHKDESWKDRLVTHLRVLEMEDLIEEWDDRRIATGDDWKPEIEAAMARCNVAILMVTANFLVSNFIRSVEVPRLLQRRYREGVRVFPIIVRPCPWEQVIWLKRMQLRPRDARPLSAGSEHDVDTELAAIANEVTSVIRHAAPGPPSGVCTALGPDKISLARLPSTSPDLFGRESELAIVDSAWENPQTNIVSVVAMGGVGKTALVNKWLLNMGADNYRGAERVYGWSFYSQGAAEDRQVSADVPIASALKWFGDPDPTEGSALEKGERLAELVNRQRTLLVIDGLEPVQYPPGETGGRLKDPGLQCLLRSLARRNLGLCILTTRLAVDDIKGFVDTWVQGIDLDDLLPEAGEQHLERLGVKGTSDELKQASSDFGGHALALTLLGTYLAVAYGGDVRQRDRIPRVMDEQKQGIHARRVMKSYEEWYKNKPELDILRIMGLFDRPAEGGAIKELRGKPAIKGLTGMLQELSDAEWEVTVNNLRAARLLHEKDERDPDALDCHPLVREHFGERLKETAPNAWKEGHSRLYDYCCKVPNKELPDTLEEMAPLFAAVAHGCEAGRHQEAWDDVFQRRIQRAGQGYIVKKLSAWGANLAAVTAFFDIPWMEPTPELAASDQAWLLSEAGWTLRALGRMDEAGSAMQAGLGAHIEQAAWKHAAIGCENLAELHEALGDLDEAVDFAKRGVDFADKSGEQSERRDNRATLAWALHQAGRLEEARNLFREAERIEHDQDPEQPYLYSFRGSHYCEFLLDEGEYEQVLARAAHTIRIAKRHDWLLIIALDQLSLGRACLMQGVAEGQDDFAEAGEHLDNAIEGLRKVGAQEFLPLGLLARAALHRVQDDFSKAQADVEEAYDIATRCGMRLHKADCHLECARLHLAMDDNEKARESLTKAKQMIEEMGYHRRDNEVKELEEKLKPKDR